MLTLPTRGFNQTYGDYLLHNLRGGFHYALDLRGSLFMILFFTEDLFENLNSLRSPFGDLWSIEGCF